MSKKKHFFRFSRESLEKMDAAARAGEQPQAGTSAPEAPKAPAFEMPRGVRIAAKTDVGLVRANNQDAPVVSGMLAGVADGMGGHKGGEVASAEARDTVIAALKDAAPDVQQLKDAVAAANAAVFRHANADPELDGMGTTLTLLWLGPEEALIAHVGDSRCYRLRGGELHQMTSDHSMVAEMVRAGYLTKEEAAVHPMRNVITRAVGTDETVDVEALSVPRQRGDRWLICSDGLHGMVEEEEMLRLLGQAPTPEETVDSLVKAALAAGGRDNVTVVVVDDGEGRA